MELLVILVAIVVFSFIVYSTYSTSNARLEQQKRAYELKANHMNKSMDKIRTEISMLEKEIRETEESFEELNDESL